MNKFLITVMIPNIELEFNVYIPNNKKIGTIKQYLLKMVVEISNGMFIKESNDTLLLDRDTGKELNNNMYVKDTGIKNGSKLIII